MHNILSLDLGKNMGWVIYNSSSNNCESGYICLDKKIYKPKNKNEKFRGRFLNTGKKFLNMSIWLSEMYLKHSFNQVYFEEVWSHRGAIDAHAYGGFLAILTAFCEANHILYTGINTKTVKKFLTGNGNANKESMIEHVNKLGFNITDHNEADAVAVLYTALSTLT